MTDSDDLLFIEEDDHVPGEDSSHCWNLLIVDDDPDVHEATRLALRGLEIEGICIQLLHAHSAAEALSILHQIPDIAVMLLDVVMESDDAGLKLVRTIREQLNNHLIRIILRTGQPGYAPEMDTIRHYDINDYKTKSELTRTRLFTSLTTAIRAYRQMRDQQDLSRGLETVVSASTELTRLQGMQRFAEGIVVQISVLLGISPEGLICAEDGEDDTPPRVIAAAGHYRHLLNEPLALLPASVGELLQQCLQKKSNQQHNGIALYFPSDTSKGLAAYIDLRRPLSANEQRLIQLFSASMAVGFDNVVLYSRMSEQAYTDPMLHTPNINQLLEWLRSDQEVREGNTLAVIDVDDFSTINDTLGHEFGDDLLNAVYQRLHTTFRQCRIARIGSDIFAIIDDDKQLTPARLSTLFSPAFLCNGDPVRVSATSGLVQLGQRQPSGSDILKDAHLALKQAKQHQRGGACYFSQTMGQQVRERMHMLGALREAFNKTQLFLTYQPKIGVRTGKTSGFEALLRWRSADGEMIPPDRFIPLAEKSGMIVALGLFVLRSACEFLKQLHDLGYQNLTMAINVSQVQLKEPDFIQRLQNILASTAVAPASIELEITESMAADDFNSLVSRLSEIRQLGVKIAIDDFGTGFSSLSVLRELPVTRLKIDRAFIIDIEQDDSIPRMVIGLGHNMGLSITAEGVETAAQKNILQALECDEIQGWYYAPALNEKDVSQWLQDH